MQVKAVIQGLAVVWLLLFVVSFVALQLTAADDSFAGGLNRIVVFLTWQGIALVVAAVFFGLRIPPDRWLALLGIGFGVAIAASAAGARRSSLIVLRSHSRATMIAVFREAPISNASTIPPPAMKALRHTSSARVLYCAMVTGASSSATRYSWIARSRRSRTFFVTSVAMLKTCV